MTRTYNKRQEWRESNGKIYLNRQVDFQVPLHKIPENVINIYKTFILSTHPPTICKKYEDQKQYSEQHIKNAMSTLRRYGLIKKEKKKTVRDDWAGYQREYRQKRRVQFNKQQ